MTKVETWMKANTGRTLFGVLLCIVFAALVGNQIMTQQSASSSPLNNFLRLGNIPGQVPKCGSPLGMAGLSITTNQSYTDGAAIKSAHLQPELSSLNAHVPLDATLGLTRMYIVHDVTLPEDSVNSDIKSLSHLPTVTFAEPIWLQSSDPRYLSCDYKLKDNSRAQSVAQKARTALIAKGVSATLLDDGLTMEFVSVRHFSGKAMLQAAFVSLPAEITPAPLPGTPSVKGTPVSYQAKKAFVAILDPATLIVVALAQANWYNN